MWGLTWADEFSGTAVDRTRWDTCFFDGARWGWPPDPHGQEWQYYTDEDVLVENGMCRLRAQKRDYVVSGVTWHYTSGMLSSALKFYQLFGRFECRCRMPQGVNGFWPAFWLCANPDPHIWPPEVDIMEQFSKSDGYYTNWTYAESPGVPHFVGFPMHPVADVSAWHTYAVEWRPDSIVFTLDGVEVARTGEQINTTLPMYILLNLAVDGGVLNPPHHAPDDDTPFPSYFDIDYVRVYEEVGMSVITDLRAVETFLRDAAAEKAAEAAGLTGQADAVAGCIAALQALDEQLDAVAVVIDEQ